jgi:hypothetical protein
VWRRGLRGRKRTVRRAATLIVPRLPEPFRRPVVDFVQIDYLYPGLVLGADHVPLLPTRRRLAVSPALANPVTTAISDRRLAFHPLRCLRLRSSRAASSSTLRSRSFNWPCNTRSWRSIAAPPPPSAPSCNIRFIAPRNKSDTLLAPCLTQRSRKPSYSSLERRRLIIRDLAFNMAIEVSSLAQPLLCGTAGASSGLCTSLVLSAESGALHLGRELRQNGGQFVR